MSNNYQVPTFSSGNSPDLLYGEAAVLSNRRAPPPNRLETFRVYGQDGKALPNVLRWEYTVFDGSGGLDAQEGAPDNRLAFSSLDHRWPGTLILNPLMGTDTSPDPTSPAVITHANIFGTLALGIGSGANTSLLVPTSATDPSPSARTYTPGGEITYLHSINVGGVANAQWLAVCRVGDNVEILSDLGTTPTSAGEISGTTNAYGIVTTPLNNTTPGALTHLIYANNKLIAKPSDNTLTTAGTDVLTQIPNGGSAICSLELGTGFHRAWWHLPRSSQTASMYGNTTVLADIVSTNWEGTDPQTLQVPVPYVQQVWRWRNGLFFTDGRSAYWHNGQINNLHWQFQREPAQDREVILRTGGVLDDRLIAVAVEMNTVDNTPTRFWLEEYLPETDAWYQITASTTVTGGVGDIIRATGQGLPMARLSSTQYGSSWAYLYDEANWRTWQMTPAGINPYYMARNTSSATVGTNYEYESSGIARSKQIFLSGLESFPSVVYEIQPLFNVNQGGTGATVEIKIANQGSNSMSFSNCLTATFRAVDRWDKHLFRSMSNTSAFNRLQWQVTQTRGSDSRVTMNSLPFVIRGLTFLDGDVQAPSKYLNLKEE